MSRGRTGAPAAGLDQRADAAVCGGWRRRGQQPVLGAAAARLHSPRPACIHGNRRLAYRRNPGRLHEPGSCSPRHSGSCSPRHSGTCSTGAGPSRLCWSARAALAAYALAPSFGVLFVAITVPGLTTVAGRILTPLAGDMANDAHRGRVVGVVVSGLLTRSQSSRSQAAVFGMLETVSRPDRITHPGKAPVNPRSLTISTPLTSTCCMPAASPYSLPAPEGRS